MIVSYQYTTYKNKYLIGILKALQQSWKYIDDKISYYNLLYKFKMINLMSKQMKINYLIIIGAVIVPQ